MLSVLYAVMYNDWLFFLKRRPVERECENFVKKGDARGIFFKLCRGLVAWGWRVCGRRARKIARGILIQVPMLPRPFRAGSRRIWRIVCSNPCQRCMTAFLQMIFGKIYAD